MDEKYMVSIIIPHYNTPDLLKRLLSTIPDKKDVQTIVVDDHSDEEVKKQLEELKVFYADRDILFLDNDTSAHNAGAARNIGLKYAEGKWILFADSDDYFLPRVYEIIKEYFNTKYDMVFFYVISRDEKTGEIGDRHATYINYLKDYDRKPSMHTEAQLRYKWAACWSKLIRASMIKGNNICFESIRYSNDNMFSAQTGFYAKSICVEKEPIYCVSCRAGSLTTYLDEEAFAVRTHVKIEKFQFLKTHLTDKEFRASDSYQLAYSQLLTIISRKYGIRCFIKYLEIFAENKMLIFDIRMFNPGNFIQWVRNCIHEHNIKKKYKP